MARSLVSICLLFIVSISFAQKGQLTGKITNNRNELLAGVSIKIKGATGGVQSNTDGTYNLPLEAGKIFEISFSYVGYTEKSVGPLQLKSGETQNLDILLETATNAAAGVIVTGQARTTTARGESINALIAYQKNTNTVAQVISAEAIRRSPDRNTGEALKRVPGTSLQEGRYLIVRGLADRYNQAMLNGILLSSTEPDRKTFSFDIFPAGMVENIIVNKAFVPELPGEWAGGLVQVNTKDIPAANYFNIQIGTGFNTETIGSDFYTYQGGKLDWLGFDDGTRALPTNNFPVKGSYEKMTPDQKTEYGKQFSNVWDAKQIAAPLNASFQMSGGLNTTVLHGKKLGVILALTYNKSNRNLAYENRFFTINGSQADVNFNYFNNKYAQDVLWGALGNISLQLNSRNRISFKNLININAQDYTTLRSGKDFELDPVNGQNIRAKELGFRSNIYYNTQVTGDHSFAGKAAVKAKWYGGFGILDQYIPDQRRIQYNQIVTGTTEQPYYLLISNTLSQKSGNRFFSNLSDYIYTAGGDVSANFNVFGSKQTIKGGYLFQVKDRLFDARPFSMYLPKDNPVLRQLPEGQIFSPENLGSAADNKFGFDEIAGNRFRYIANSILNAGYVQLDNQFGKDWRLVWGARVESFDQLIGSQRQSDERHVHTKRTDILPGLNLTYKLNTKTNIRFSGSQTVIRPEFRELSPFAFFDFELGSTLLGNPALVRTKITNLDLRYELYPRAGELITVGVFYKYFKNPIELYFNQSGVGTSNTFNFLNAEKATGYGLELEFRKKLDFSTALRNFTAFSNLSFIKNRVSGENIDRPMQGQSPYLINVGLQYDLDNAGLNTTLLFNQLGRRILYVGNDQVPAIWENGRPLLDFQIAKKIMKNKGEVKLNLQDILNQRAYFYHDLDANNKFGKTTDGVAISRKYGTTVSLTFGYTIK